MPPKSKFSKEEIVAAAVALTARSLAQEQGITALAIWLFLRQMRRQYNRAIASRFTNWLAMTGFHTRKSAEGILRRFLVRSGL